MSGIVHPNRADEVQSLLKAVEDLLIPFIRSADENLCGGSTQKNGTNGTHGHTELTVTSLVNYKKPEELRDILKLEIPEKGTKQEGLIEVLQKVLKYSVNTWHQGFLDKLYASTNAPGVAAELILATLNTNVHVYQVSPALTVIEKYTGQRLANLFGLNGPQAGGISVQGGSASNTTSIVIARNNLYPSTKTDGNGEYKFVLFTSAHGHYSVEKAAQMLGFGSSAVWPVPIDKVGRMIPAELEKLVQKAQSEGRTPFYVNAPAGTTVLGSFDPFNEIAAICQKYNMWFHIDGSWGGSFVFSQRQKHKLAGAEKANSIAINPTKMLGVPVTCSYLLASDMRQFHMANTLPRDIYFTTKKTSLLATATSWKSSPGGVGPGRPHSPMWSTCGFPQAVLGWTYYGNEGYRQQIDSACDIAAHLANTIEQHPDFVLISENPPPCLQVCFYYAPGKEFVYPRGIVSNEAQRAKNNSKVTEQVTHAIVHKGFMVDFAPPSGDDDAAGNGKFFRCVVNVQTTRETVDSLVRTIEEVGPGIVESLKASNSAVKRLGERGHGPVVHRV
ncbi:hypothetical protein PDIDSM_752 [Penicillium digitatum]|nr:hypothetical protein PDIDSM_752 [Penicillium digitatum]